MAPDQSTFDLCTNCGCPVVNTEECSMCSACGQFSHAVCGPVHQEELTLTRRPWMGVITRRGDHP